MTLAVHWLVHPSDCRLARSQPTGKPYLPAFPSHCHSPTRAMHAVNSLPWYQPPTLKDTTVPPIDSNVLNVPPICARLIRCQFDSNTCSFLPSVHHIHSCAPFRQVHVQVSLLQLGVDGMEWIELDWHTGCMYANMQMKIQWTECTKLLSVNWSRISRERASLLTHSLASPLVAAVKRILGHLTQMCSSQGKLLHSARITQEAGGERCWGINKQTL